MEDLIQAVMGELRAKFPKGWVRPSDAVAACARWPAAQAAVQAKVTAQPNAYPSLETIELEIRRAALTPQLRDGLNIDQWKAKADEWQTLAESWKLKAEAAGQGPGPGAGEAALLDGHDIVWWRAAAWRAVAGLWTIAHTEGHGIDYEWCRRQAGYYLGDVQPGAMVWQMPGAPTLHHIVVPDPALALPRRLQPVPPGSGITLKAGQQMVATLDREQPGQSTVEIVSSQEQAPDANAG